MDLLDHLKKSIAIATGDSEFSAAILHMPCQLVLQVQTENATESLVVAGAEQAQRIVLQAAAATWEKIASRHPPAGYQSFTAVTRSSDNFVAEGSALQIAQALHALERFFEILRGQTEDAALPAAPALSALQGRYARVMLPGNHAADLYYDCSGDPAAPPLVMLHTAGADARQYHPLLADAELQKSWRMYAFDMPAHGRSMPIAGTLWQEYRLRKTHYLEVCRAFVQQVVGQPAVMLGCSMGAAMVLKMAVAFPEQVAGVVALEAPLRAKGRRTPLLAHPQVNQAAHNPSYVRGLMSPLSPLAGRRTAAWIYSQGGFQVYSGDLAFYSEEFDAEIDLQGLDGNRIGIALLTGSYDYSASPEDSRKVAAMIPGARFTEMPELGHFPMIENPPCLLAYLKPELTHIRSRLKR